MKMWNNRRFLSVAVVAVCVGFVNTDSNGAAPIEFEGRFGLCEPLTVGITAGTSDNPELVRIEWIRFDPVYANAWRVTAHMGWLPVKDTTWRLTIELLDSEGNVLRHSRDEPTVFTCKAGTPSQTDMRYVDLGLDAMQDQGRRHTARFRVLLVPSEERITDEDAHTIEVEVLDQESREPISDATVVVSRSYLKDTFWRREKTLYVTDSQGRCRAKLARDGLALIGVSAQKQDYCTIAKSWSNSGSWPLSRAPIVNLPQHHVLEMVRGSALGGIVRDTEGNPLAGAEVCLEAYSEEPSGIMTVSRAVRTDTNGRWRVDGVSGEVERVTLRVKHPKYGGDNGRNRHISGDALVNARNLKHVVTLDKGITITGRVLDNQGQPITRATVMLAQQSYNAMYSLTDTSGAFRLVCSSDPSDYPEAPAIIVEASGYASVLQPFALQPDSKTLELRLQRGRSVTCRVVDTKGQPVPGAWTTFHPLPDYRDYLVWLKDTDDRGEFHIPNAPQNDMKLTVGKEGYLAIRDHLVTASENEVVVTMKRAMSVHGTVTDAETGKPIPNFEIAAVYTTGGRANTSSPVAFVEGTYEISFDEARPENGQLKAFAVGYEPDTSKEIKIDEVDYVINFKLARSPSFDQATAGRPREQIQPNGPRRITGVVRDEQGKPVPDVVIRTFPWMGKEIITNANGAFTLKLRGTSGLMGARSREEATYLMARHYERNLAAALMLDTSADTVDVTLTLGVILSGKVVDIEGKGIRSAQLSLTFWTTNIGYGRRESVEIDGAGHYEIRAIPAGQRYSVNANAEGYGERYVQVNTGEGGNQRLEVEPLVLSVANLSASGVVIDDLDQPVSGIRIYAYGNGQPSRETFTDTKGRFTIENVCPGRINIQANSKGDSVHRFHGQAQAEGGTTNIKIIAYQMDEHGRRVPSQPPSLTNKSLPDLKELGTEISTDDIKGQRILVCFWDFEQRPSRQFLTQLAKQAEQFKNKNVTVIAVQASNIDQEVLNQWVKKNNIPFPTGMVQGDDKKARLNWGVQSLPWLILTDRQRIVRAEGFGLDTFDDQIEALRKE
jgi:protocatechuate 3,4-dioxygenase beta subunit